MALSRPLGKPGCAFADSAVIATLARASVVVPVPLVSGVAMTVVNVVDVAVVRDRHVAAALTVLVIMPGVLDVGGRVALVGMVIVGSVQVPVVNVVDVAVVRDRRVAAPLTVPVVVSGVRAVLG
ncbi:hypothetical protein GCM10022252_62530 [Streptosporangium oxazolinicum]|uniref:Uncharacterized protein n=1 Tax=Streptosporangium oxazolinicum TaxID=909287 RepID=A0ABP8BDE1_9ACTN